VIKYFWGSRGPSLTSNSLPNYNENYSQAPTEAPTNCFLVNSLYKTDDFKTEKSFLTPCGKRQSTSMIKIKKKKKISNQSQPASFEQFAWSARQIYRRLWRRRIFTTVTREFKHFDIDWREKKKKERKGRTRAKKMFMPRYSPFAPLLIFQKQQC